MAYLRHEPLFGQRDCLGLVVCWICIWVTAHHVLWLVWQRGRIPILPRSPLDRYRRRLCRSQVYCAIACTGGFHLFSECGFNPKDLIHTFSTEYQLLFSMAVGHWIVAIWEDAQCKSFLAAGMSTKVTRHGRDVGDFLAKAYMMHHVVAAWGFAMLLYLQVCTGIGIFGLIFELPVLLMNHREFAVCMDPRPKWLYDLQDLNRFWSWLTLFFGIGRVLPTLVYIYSLIFWIDELSLLSYTQLAMYHFMSLFFTALNYALNKFLGTWKKSDTFACQEWSSSHTSAPAARRVSEQGTSCDGDEEFGEEDGEEDDKNTPLGGKGAAEALKDIEEDVFRTKRGGEDASCEVWIEVDGIAYDVTAFLQCHPGGEAPLRRYAGRDASEAFHRVRHSMKAKLMMQRFAVGAIVKKRQAYRIFEHNDLMLTVLMTGLGSFLRLGLSGMLLPRTVVWKLLRSVKADAPLAMVLAPGLILSATLGGFVLAPMLVTGRFFAYITWRSALTGLCLTLQCSGLILSRTPLPVECASSCPTGTELAAVGLFFLEELADFTKCRKHWSWNVLIGGAAVGLGWSLRGIAQLLSCAPYQCAAPVLVVCSSCFLVRVAGSTRAEEAIPTDLVVGIALSCVFSVLCLLALTSAGPEVEQALTELWTSSYWSFVCSIPGLYFTVSLLKSTLENASAYSPSWSARCLAHCLGVNAGLSHGFSSWRWLSWVAWFAHQGSVAMRYRKQQDEAIDCGTFSSVPDFIVGTRNLWDTFRSGCCALIWALVHRPMSRLVNAVLPEELSVWGNTIPIFDLGDMVDYGVAAYTAPPQSGLARTAPEHFSCTIKHNDSSTATGVQDSYRTMNSLRRAWKHMKAASTQGLDANVVCFFPHIRGTALEKQIHIECWQSREDAQAWLMENNTVSGGNLPRHGGQVQAMLRPQCKIRHQDRCESCYRLVESRELGRRAPLRCNACGGGTRGYRFF